MPRAIAVSMLLVVAGCPRSETQGTSEPASDPQATDESHRRAIAATVAGYVDSLAARDAASAASWVTSDTFEYYERMRVLALSGTRSELDQRDMMEVVMVLELRSRFTRTQLEGLDGRRLFDDLITAGMPAAPLALDELWLDESAGRAEIRVEGELMLCLRREQGLWRVDLPALIEGLTPVLETELADAIVADGKLRVAYTLIEVEREAGKGLDIAILDGPLDSLP